MFFVVTRYSFGMNDSTVNYYSNGKAESVIYYKKGIRDGEGRFYFENGNLRREVVYVNGVIDGTVKDYYENGNLKELYELNDGKREGPTSYFDSSGLYLDDRTFIAGKLKDVIDKENEPPLPPSEKKEVVMLPPPSKETPKKTPTKKKEVESNYMGLPIEQKKESLEDDPAYYLNVEIMPEPVNGWNAFYERLVFPELARKHNIKGTVIARTFITRYGDVEKIEITQGLPYGCSDMAEILIYYTKFKPGILKGKKVNVQMDIEIEFK